MINWGKKLGQNDGYKEHVNDMVSPSGASEVKPSDAYVYGEYKGDMPSEEELMEAFEKAAASGEPGNAKDCKYVQDFMKLIDTEKVLPGDIILISKPSTEGLHPISAAVPGKYSHVAVFLGKDSRGRACSIDAWKGGAPIRTAEYWPMSYNTWSIVRPQNSDGTDLSEEDRKKVVDFAKSAEGCEYNFNWPTNNVVLPVEKEKTKFYCSQLAWAAYYHTTGINIDQHPGFHIKYAWGVAPQEIHDAPNVKIIAEGNNIAVAPQS